MGKKIVMMLAVAGFLLLQFADCMSAMTPDDQSMECCASMPCTPANHSHGCCKTMTSGQTPNVLPTAPVAPASTIAIIEYTQPFESASLGFEPVVTIQSQQYSPPELYTLHASLLI